MRIKTKKVYYCEFCNKHKLNKHSILLHEKHCTLNPFRFCRMCEQNYNYLDIVANLKIKKEKVIVENNKQAYKAEISKDTILDLVEGCPACALTVLRLFIHRNKNKFIHFETDFDYEKEKRDWWESLRDKDYEDSGYY